MRKKNKLYTANKWNQPLFAYDIDREHQNIFDGLGTSKITDPHARGKNIVAGTNYLVSAATKRKGLFEGAEDLKGGIGLGTVETAAKKELSKPIGGLRKPASAGGGMSTDIQAGLLAGGTALGGIAANAISDGYESSAGNTISSVGSTVGSAVGAVNPVAGAIVSVGSQLVGGLTNRAFGTKVDEAKLAQANTDINRLNSFTSNAGSFDGIIGPEATASVAGTYKGGWFNHSAARKQKELEDKLVAARQFADRSIDNNIYNIADDQINNALANYAAFGGPLGMINDDNDMGAINYGFMSDYLTGLNDRAKAKNTSSLTNINKGPIFALGGDLQTNGSDFTTGLMHISAGGSHEESPYDGVQLGQDQNSVPNLVEEGETVFDDYVYSARIQADQETLKKFHLPKKAKLTYADISKKLEKEATERPNDPISQAGLKAQMHDLADEQERQKAEMEAARAKEAFEALSPEEQTAIMQQVAQQEQMAQEQAAAQEAAAQQQLGQPMPEEAIPEQAMMGDGSEAMIGAAPQMNAYGGKLYAGGGALEWAIKKGFGPNDAKYIAAALEKAVAKNPSRYTRVDTYLTGGSSEPYINYDAVYNSMIPTLTSTKEKWFNEWVKLGVPRNLAFGITHSMPVPGDKKGMREREQAYNRLVRNYKKPASTSRTAPAGTFGYSSIPFGYPAFTPSNLEPVYSLERPTETTAAPAPVATQTPPVQGASVAKVVTQPEAPSTTLAATTPGSTVTRATTTPRASRENSPVDNSVTGVPYDWYRNGSDGYSTPTGFTVGANGLIDKENGYTQEYRDLVAKATVDDIRTWAKEHPQDPSLLSFLARGNRLEDLTTEQWRKGATDGKYGFMHHVADQLLNASANDDALTEAQLTAAGVGPRVFHAMDGDDYDGYIEGELDPTRVGAETRREVLPNGDTVIYHGKPADTGSTPATTATEDKEEFDVAPVYANDKLRYAGLFGPAVGLGLMTAGVGRPDYSGLNAAISSVGTPHLAGYKTLGNYLTYKPLDIWFEQNRQDAAARATDRAIRNSGTSQGTITAGLLANGYNSQLANGQLFRQAQEYNDNLRARVGEFNRGTDQFNAQAFNQNQQFNAEALNRNRQLGAQMRMQAAQQQLDADAGWYNSLYGNVGNIFKGISDLGTENARHNMIAEMAATGLFGNMTPKTPIAGKYLKVAKKAKQSKEGGKINKKKGFTY